jgi:taurine dioxygenase
VSGTYTTFRVEPKAGNCGADIYGLDLSKPLDDATFAELHAAFLEYLVLAIRDQDITPEQHLEFGRRWGTVLPHPYVPSIEGYPGVMRVYDPNPVTQTWHSDFTYAERPSKLAILVARVLPPVGGDTMFSNQYLAFETLSPKLQEVLLGLKAFHKGTSLAKEAGLSDEDVSRVHPVVRTHPETGRKALYVNADYTKHFDGMTVEESAPLLEFLYRHAANPEFTCRHRWRDGDVLMWDNRAVQHAVVGDVKGHPRELHRVTVEGEVPE